jgi:hypothetical protein
MVRQLSLCLIRTGVNFSLGAEEMRGEAVWVSFYFEYSKVTPGGHKEMSSTWADQ